MNGDFELSELFDQYLGEEMTLSQKRKFEARLENDPEFAALFQLHKEVDQSLMDEEMRRFRDRLVKIRMDNRDLITEAPLFLYPDQSGSADNSINEMNSETLVRQLDTIRSSFVDDGTSSLIPEYSGDNLGRLSREVDQAIMEEDVAELRETLSGIANKVNAQTKPYSLRRRWQSIKAVAAAAIAFLIISSASIAFLTSQYGVGQPPDKPFFEPYTGLTQYRGPVEADQVIFRSGVNKFNEGDYNGSLEMMELSMKAGVSDDFVLLYAGMSAYLAGDPKLAEQYLTRISREAIISDQMEWYLAGALITQRRYGEAIGLLQEMKSDSNHFYSEQAEALLPKIEKRLK